LFISGGVMCERRNLLARGQTQSFLKAGADREILVIYSDLLGGENSAGTSPARPLTTHSSNRASAASREMPRSTANCSARLSSCDAIVARLGARSAEPLTKLRELFVFVHGASTKRNVGSISNDNDNVISGVRLQKRKHRQAEAIFFTVNDEGPKLAHLATRSEERDGPRADIDGDFAGYTKQSSAQFSHRFEPRHHFLAEIAAFGVGNRIGIEASFVWEVTRSHIKGDRRNSCLDSKSPPIPSGQFPLPQRIGPEPPRSSPREKPIRPIRPSPRRPRKTNPPVLVRRPPSRPNHQTP